MSARFSNPPSSPLTEVQPIDDVELLQQQLSSLQIALESSEQTITDLRNKAERTLWSIGSKVGPFPDHLPCIAFLKDATFRYIYVNKHWERTHNKTLSEWYNKTDYDLFPYTQAEETRRADRKVLRTGSSLQNVDVQSEEGRSSYWLLTRFPVEGGLLGGVAMDITELRHTEQALHETEERYRELFNSVLAGVYRTTPQGEVLLANPALIRMLGYEPDVQPCRLDLTQAYNRSHSASRFIETMERGGQVLGFETVWQRLDGSDLPVRETAKAVRNSAGEVLYYEGVVEDLTETRRAQLLEKDRNHLLELVATNESLTTIFTELCLMIERQFPGHVASAMLLRDARLEMLAAPNLSPSYTEELRDGVPVGPENGSCGAAAYRGEPVIVTDIEEDPVWHRFRDLATRHHLKSCWSVPILSATRTVLGTIAVYDTVPSHPSESELDLLEMASRLACIALENRQLLLNLERQANFDPLSGLPNRSLLEDRLEAALENARKNTSHLGLLWIDLDRFKEINDTLGHHIGDLLLLQVARRLKHACNPEDTLARMGGDEFALLLPVLNARHSAEQSAQSLLAALSTPFQIEGYELFVTASIGICIYPEDGLDSATLRRNADRAMYRAKSRGRNGFHAYERETSAGALQRLNLESNMRRALERGEFELYYQPQVDLNGNLKGMEGLLRWNHPKHGVLSPARFIPIAEESGLIVPIGDWVVKQACRQLAIWKNAAPSLKIAVNVSALQFYYGDFVETVREALLAGHIEPSCLEIELTETLIMHNYGESARQLDKLRALGISIAIDDFGTGYSCLSNLQRLPVNAVKIDRSFLTEIEVSTNAAVVTAISMLSRSLGLSVIAEGVERPEQIRILKTIGVDLMQGYLIGRPLPADATEERFLKQTT
jgi:diguanylate cyclase (GGDEF)-like protein/PAS domain S-box-containing protein